MAAHTSSPYKRSETPASSVLPGTHSRPRFIFGTNADQVVMIGPKTNDRLAFTLAPALEIEFVCAERRFDVSPPIVDNESGGFNAQKLSQAPQDQWDMLTQAPTSHIVANLGGIHKTWRYASSEGISAVQTFGGA